MALNPTIPIGTKDLSLSTTANSRSEFQDWRPKSTRSASNFKS